MSPSVNPVNPTELYSGRSVMDREAEMALLGSMVLENELIGDALEIVTEAGMFAYPAHQTLYKAVTVMYLERRPVDLVTLKAEIEKEPGRLPSIGGADYLLALVSGVPNTTSLRHYAEIVREKWILREILGVCQSISHRIYEQTQDVEELRAEAERALFTVLSKGDRRKIGSMTEILHEVFRSIQDVHDRRGRLLGIPTGYYELDDILSGLQKGQLYIVAGRPSMGKTSLAMNIVENVALREGKPVLFFSLEMAASQIAQSMLCSHARVDSSLLRSGKIGEEDFQKLVLAAGAFHEAKIFIDDSADLSALEMRTKAKRFASAEKIELVVVDYLQKMNARGIFKGPESRQVEISQISHNLKALAKDLDVPVIAAAQLNRNSESRDDRRPVLSDLRESGAIEQDADAVVLLFREDYYNTESEKKGVAELNVAKNRTGPTGIVELAFLKKFTRFENLAASTTPG
jgi:replicative DNA helicase